MYEHVFLNQYGYYELKNKPTKDELDEYYSKKYYQDPKGSYEASYSPEEITYSNNQLERKYYLIRKLIGELDSNQSYKFLDIGCGEGWALKFFKEKSWQVTGMDFSNYGCKQFNPDCVEDILVGDIEKTIKSSLNKGKYHCILLDNVLEHLLDPLETLKYCSSLLEPNGVLIIEVPNDFSPIQKKLYEENYVSRNYWVVSPDHISYFNRMGLASLCKEAGFSEEYFIGDYPIDLNLFNPNTNYINDSTKGNSCHKERIAIENLLNDLSIEKTLNLYSALGELGFGRQLTGFFQKKECNL
ncbi:class I SAM-dependent methyltransferase [Paenibacillus sp. Aloe-11]|uniref:class I SAM-dependent methyltransferase n=1 Tax=Paenibacillus sp. Aloe-11 TaxID=1050222 RepID=UPI000308724D|nr:class I SAM-dependent methyltransferase [Paenibacillus sp. Aloe-11]